jgi:DNA polymerase-3 subunit delta'
MMANAKGASRQEESADQREGARHPRDTASLFGHGEAERTFLNALRSGRMHHAWLICGAEGIGKATFCYRAARFVLANGNGGEGGEGGKCGDELAAAEDLALAVDHPAFRRVSAQAHPDLYVLRRSVDPERGGKLRTAIAAADARRAASFFNKTAAGGGWRVCIVDHADELNRAAANALLKTLEEPPPRSLFLIAANTPGRLPATIRSRCRRLALRGLSAEDVDKALREAVPGGSYADLSANEQRQLAVLAGGSAGRAVSLLAGGGLELNRELTDLLEGLPAPDPRKLHRFMDKIARPGAERHYDMAVELIADWIAARALAGAAGSEAGGGEAGGGTRIANDRARVWQRINDLARQRAVYNFDKRRTLLAIFNSLAAA